MWPNVVHEMQKKGDTKHFIIVILKYAFDFEEDLERCLKPTS